MATLGEQAVGSIVKFALDVSSIVNFIVVHKGVPSEIYDISCDGVWLLAEQVQYQKKFHTSANNNYTKSDIHTFLNATFLDRFSALVSEKIISAKIPYRVNTTSTPGSVVSGASGLQTKAFLLSRSEINGSSPYTDGAVLDYFVGADNSKRIAPSNTTGAASTWFTRTPESYSTANEYYVTTSGGFASNNVNLNSRGIRPAIIMPYDVAVLESGLIDGSNASAGAITGSVNINGVQRELTGKGYINIGGVLRDLSDSQVNIGGILESLKG